MVGSATLCSKAEISSRSSSSIYRTASLIIWEIDLFVCTDFNLLDPLFHCRGVSVRVGMTDDFREPRVALLLEDFHRVDLMLSRKRFPNIMQKGADPYLFRV